MMLLDVVSLNVVVGFIQHFQEAPTWVSQLLPHLHMHYVPSTGLTPCIGGVHGLIH